MKDLTVYKPNELIEIVGSPITTTGLLTYNFLLHKFKELKTDHLEISLNEISSYIGLSRNYDELYNYLDLLQSIRVESRDKKGKLWGAFNLLAVFQKRENGVFVQIPRPIFVTLCGKGTKENENLYYTAIKILEQNSFKCSYSSIFYEVFKKYEKINLPIFDLNELKELTGTINKYSEYKDFKRYVLKKSLEEVNRIEKIYEYSFEEKKLGKKVNEIKFIRTIKTKIKELKPISEKLGKEILKARKNRFIDEAYSEKSMLKLLEMYKEIDIIKALKELIKYNKEIINFSKIMISKIEDIKNSKKIIEEPVIISKKSTLGEKELRELEPQEELTELDMFKDELSKKIFSLTLKMSMRINLISALRAIKSIDELHDFIKINNLEDL